MDKTKYAVIYYDGNENKLVTVEDFGPFDLGRFLPPEAVIQTVIEIANGDEIFYTDVDGYIVVVRGDYVEGAVVPCHYEAEWGDMREDGE